MKTERRLTAPQKGQVKIMSAYEIFYTYEGKQYSVVEQSTKGWESQFQQNVINRIESLVSLGAVITDLRKLY